MVQDSDWNSKEGSPVNSKITIHDVAERCGVSISTVHQALYGKKGVSDQTRDRIRQVAEEMGYSPNPMASSLKRKTKHVALIFPNSNYYGTVWSGARDYLSGVRNGGLEWTEMPLGEGGLNETSSQLVQRLRAQGIDGILMTGHSDIFTEDDWADIRESGIAVSLLGADMPQSGRIFCVLPDYEIIGRTMAELVLSRVPFYGSIAICAGNPKWEPHARVVLGFEEYLKECNAQNHIYMDHSWNKGEDSYRGIVKMLERSDVAACCSVLSQSSLLLGRALRESGKAGKIFAVGSDLSPENIDCLKTGVFNNLIQKNPYAQGYLGARNLGEYLMFGKKPETDKLLVGSEVVFRSNVSMYENWNYRQLLH